MNTEKRAGKRFPIASKVYAILMPDFCAMGFVKEIGTQGLSFKATICDEGVEHTAKMITIVSGHDQLLEKEIPCEIMHTDREGVQSDRCFGVKFKELSPAQREIVDFLINRHAEACA